MKGGTAESTGSITRIIDFIHLIGFHAKIFYLTPRKYFGDVKKGSVLGISRALPHPGITQHLHLMLYENDELIDPTNYL